MKPVSARIGTIGGMIALPLFLLLGACTDGAMAVPADQLAGPCSVTDGDTIRCGEERIRLLAIDAPEKAGHCRPGRDCAPGDPTASSRRLERAMQDQELSIRRVGQDRYGRTLAVVYAGGANLSCSQLQAGAAVYVRKWDDGGMVQAECPNAAHPLPLPVSAPPSNAALR